MEGNLFTKYTTVIKKRNSTKETLITEIQNHTGLVFKEQEINIQSKKVSFYSSSSKKAELVKKGITQFLNKKGYITTLH